MLGHYLWPPRWIGGAPDWVDSAPAPFVPKLSDLVDVIADAELPQHIRVRAFRDGMIAYDISAWGELDPKGTSQDADAFFAQSLQLINAHLACLQSVLGVNARFSVASAWSVMQIFFDNGKFLAMTAATDGGATLDLYQARDEPVDRPYDWRYDRYSSLIISVEAVERSFELLGKLLEAPKSKIALQRAELMLRSGVALFDRDLAGAVVHAWTAIESLLGDLFDQFLEEYDSRAGTERTTIDGGRRQFLGRMTAKHTIEFLSLNDRLPSSLYDSIERCRKARNAWLHELDMPSGEDANDALQAARNLFELTEGIRLGPSPDSPEPA